MVTAKPGPEETRLPAHGHRVALNPPYRVPFSLPTPASTEWSSSGRFPNEHGKPGAQILVSVMHPVGDSQEAG